MFVTVPQELRATVHTLEQRAHLASLDFSLISFGLDGLDSFQVRRYLMCVTLVLLEGHSTFARSHLHLFKGLIV